MEHTISRTETCLKSMCYNEMAKDGCVIKTFKIDEHISFGTPDEYDVAINDERLRELN